VTGGNTSGMIKHLTSSKHNMKQMEVEKASQSIVEVESDDGDSSVTTSSSISSSASKKRKHNSQESQPIKKYFKSVSSISFQGESMASIFSELLAKDNFNMNQLIGSRVMRILFANSKIELPSSNTTLTNYLNKFAESCRENVKLEIEKLKKNGKKFCFCVDEATTIGNYRILNIHLFSTNFSYNLGNVYIKNTCTATEMKTMIQERLSIFGIDLNKDVIAFMSDGANVCKALGKQLNIIHQLCLDHGVHLAVVKVLYSQMAEVVKQKTNAENVLSSSPNIEDIDEVLEQKLDDFITSKFPLQNDVDDDTNDENIQNINVIDLEYENESDLDSTDYDFSVANLILNVRKVVKFFKSSPSRNSFLQVNIKQKKGKELKLILDVKTRWNSLLSMLKRFSEVLECVKLTLIELERFDLWDFEFDTKLQDIVDVLDDIKTTTSFLSLDQSNLLIAEISITELFAKLREKNTELSLKLLNQLEIEISQRRLKKVIDLIKVLKNPLLLDKQQQQQQHKSSEKIFKMQSSSTIIDTAVKFYEKYFYNEEESDNLKQNESEICEKPSQQVESLSLYDSIGKKIGMQESFSMVNNNFNQIFLF
jgi:hypothetical protein